MPVFQNHTGINITDSKMQLVEVIYAGEEFTIENVDEEYFDEFLDFSAKETKIMSLLQGAFDDLLMRKPLQSKVISFTLPHQFFRTFEVPFDNSLIQGDLIEQFRWELSQLFPKLSPDEMIIQYFPVDNFQKGSDSKAIVLAVFRKHLKLLNNFCAQNDLKLKFIDNVHLAANSVVLINQPEDTGDPVLSVYVTGDYLSVAVLAKNKLTHFNIIPLLNATEIIPRLAEEFSTQRFNFTRVPAAKGYIAGENISDSLLEKARQALNITFERYNPFELLSVNPDLFDKKTFTGHANSFAAAAGIAYRMV